MAGKGKKHLRHSGMKIFVDLTRIVPDSTGGMTTWYERERFVPDVSGVTVI